MTTENLPNFFERRDIPPEHRKLYDAAVDSRIYFVKSLAHHPSHSDPEFIVTKPIEDQLIAKVEQSYADVGKDHLQH